MHNFGSEHATPQLILSSAAVLLEVCKQSFLLSNLASRPMRRPVNLFFSGSVQTAPLIPFPCATPSTAYTFGLDPANPDGPLNANEDCTAIGANPPDEAAQPDCTSFSDSLRSGKVSWGGSKSEAHRVSFAPLTQSRRRKRKSYVLDGFTTIIEHARWSEVEGGQWLLLDRAAEVKVVLLHQTFT